MSEKITVTEMGRVAIVNVAATKPTICPDYVALLLEARDFGQFAQDFNQPLAKPLRSAICQLLDYIERGGEVSKQHSSPAYPSSMTVALNELESDMFFERRNPPMNRDIFQTEVGRWLVQCFGPKVAASKVERNHRFLEESLELVQSLGLSSEEAHGLVDYVFTRPAGEPEQEVGGVMTTLAALCFANDMNMRECGNAELTRVTAPEMIWKIQEKQAQKPKNEANPSYDTLLAEVKVLRVIKTRMDALREECGYVEDGSSCTVKIYQDDATKDWFFKSGNKATAFYSPSFGDLFDVVAAFVKKERENEKGV